MALDEDGSGFLDEEEFVQVFFFLCRIFSSYIRHEDFRPSVPETLSMTLVLPPLKSETGWTWELWSKANLLNWQNQENSVFLAIFLLLKLSDVLKKVIFLCFFFILDFWVFCYDSCRFVWYFLFIIWYFLGLFKFLWDFCSFLKINAFFLDKKKLLLNLTEVTTEDQKWPKVGTNNVKRSIEALCRS